VDGLAGVAKLVRPQEPEICRGESRNWENQDQPGRRMNGCGCGDRNTKMEPVEMAREFRAEKIGRDDGKKAGRGG
jgi:hypothetical protein